MGLSPRGSLKGARKSGKDGPADQEKVYIVANLPFVGTYIACPGFYLGPVIIDTSGYILVSTVAMDATVSSERGASGRLALSFYLIRRS